MSIADLSEQTGLTNRIIRLAVQVLAERGFVTCDAREDDIGALVLRVNEERFACIGVNVLDDRIVGVLTNLRAEVLHRCDRSLVDHQPDSVVDAVTELINELRSGATGRSLPERLIGVGIELGGHVDGRSGTVLCSPNLGWTEPVPLANRIKERTGLETFVENDLNALAIQEQLFGRGRETRWFGIVLVDEGIGAGLIHDGRLAHGAAGLSGELGHVVLTPDGLPCRCGGRGCLESFASVYGILNSIERASGTRPSSIGEAADLAERGDEPASLAFDEAARGLGRGISAMLNLSNLDRLVLALPEPLVRPHTNLARRFEETVRRVVADATFSTRGRGCRIDFDFIDDIDESGARGAASVVLQRFVNRPLTYHPKPLAARAADGPADATDRDTQVPALVESNAAQAVGHTGEETIVLTLATDENDPHAAIAEQLSTLVGAEGILAGF